MIASKPAIILIEDNDVTLELYQRELCKAFTVFPFTVLTGVLELIASHDIRAIVIEPEIGAGEGWELVHSLPQVFPERSIPIVVCSTRDNSGSRTSMEVSQYLTKPVLPKVLLEKTVEAIRKAETGTGRA